MNRRNHSFVMESKLHDVKGRVDYISSPKRQENLYAVFSNVEDSYWDLLTEQNQRDFAKSGTEGTCIEARELIIMLPPSLIDYDHDLLLKYMTSIFLEKYDVGCYAALHHNKSKTNLHIHLIFPALSQALPDIYPGSDAPRQLPSDKMYRFRNPRRSHPDATAFQP